MHALMQALEEGLVVRVLGSHGLGHHILLILYLPTPESRRLEHATRQQQLLCACNASNTYAMHTQTFDKQHSPTWQCQP